MRQFIYALSMAVLWLPLFSYGQTFVRDTFMYAGLERSYILYVPANYQPKQNWPLVMGLHGGGNGNGETLLTGLPFQDVADTEDFLVLFPNGYTNQWADGRGVTGPDTSGVDDVQFLNDLLDSINVNYPFDQNNVFVAGASNGGMMTQRLACESTGTFNAYATIIASMPDSVNVGCSPSSNAVPMLLMNGTDDTLVPYSGGPLSPLTDGGSVIGTNSTIQFWRNNNGCNFRKVVYNFPNIDLTDGSTVRSTTYYNCTGSSEVVLYRVQGGGHTIPGMPTVVNPRPLAGYVNYDIEAAVEIWDFFKDHLVSSSPRTQAPTTEIEPSIQLVPNPTQGKFFIQGLETVQDLNIQVIDMNGRMVLNVNNQPKLDMTRFPTGMYSIKVTFDGQSQVLSLIKDGLN
ncbi:MAG: T9SS type A sorting domain-containing protein [Bacteroidota bacterium]